MKKILKWVLIGIGVLRGVVILAAGGLVVAGGVQINKTYQVPEDTARIPGDAAALERGEHLANAICTECHGEVLSGQALIDDPSFATIYAPNLTPGKGGVGSYSDAELVRAIRHGVAPDGRSLIIMPAEAFIHFSEEDLGAVIAYLRALPPIDHETPPPSFTPMARAFLAAGMVGDIIPAAYIDHSQPFSPMPEVGANAAYGGYLSNFCTSCHGADLTGGESTDPACPAPPDLTSTGNVGNWSEEEFLTTLLTGMAPNGLPINPDCMPTEVFSKFYKEELIGLYLYLQSQPGS